MHVATLKDYNPSLGLKKDYIFSNSQMLMMTISNDQKFDLTITLGAFTALYWCLYVDPLTGELLGLILGSIPVLVGVFLYIESEQYILQSLIGIAAVALGGGTPATVLYRTPMGNWLVGSQPLPLSLGIMLVVVVATLVGRRYAQSVGIPNNSLSA